MSAVISRPPFRRSARALGPVPVVIDASRLLHGPTGPLLELRLVLRLADVPQDQRRGLAALLHSGDRLALTVTEAPTLEGKG